MNDSNESWSAEALDCLWVSAKVGAWGASAAVLMHIGMSREFAFTVAIVGGIWTFWRHVAKVEVPK